jgi:hypothetical protein
VPALGVQPLAAALALVLLLGAVLLPLLLLPQPASARGRTTAVAVSAYQRRGSVAPDMFGNLLMRGTRPPLVGPF